MADVDDMDGHTKIAGGMKIPFHELGEVLLLFLGDLGVAVSGQVDEEEQAVDVEDDDETRLAGHRADPRQSPIVAQCVDERGFPDVRAAHHDDFRTFRRGEAGEVTGDRMESGPSEIHEFPTFLLTIGRKSRLI
jgi:hypothetical protein